MKVQELVHVDRQAYSDNVILYCGVSFARGRPSSKQTDIDESRF